MMLTFENIESGDAGNSDIRFQHLFSVPRFNRLSKAPTDLARQIDAITMRKLILKTDRGILISCVPDRAPGIKWFPRVVKT